ncbi:MAG: YIP1 family protein [Vampirovibrionia bacterium]
MSGTLLSNIYGALFSPIETFKSIAENDKPQVFEAFVILVLVSVTASINFSSTQSIWFLVFSILTYVVGAVISWVFIAAIIDAISMIFTKTSKFDTLLTLTSFSIIPWLLIGPVSLFKLPGLEGIGILGVLISIILGIIIWFWTAILFLMAVSYTYKLSAGRVIILALMPFVASIIAISWLSGFITNFVYLISV